MSSTANIEALLQRVTLNDSCGVIHFDSPAGTPQGTFASLSVLLLPPSTVWLFARQRSEHIQRPLRSACNLTVTPALLIFLARIGQQYCPPSYMVQYTACCCRECKLQSVRAVKSWSPTLTRNAKLLCTPIHASAWAALHALQVYLLSCNCLFLHNAATLGLLNVLMQMPWCR